MLKELRHKNTGISDRRNTSDLQLLFGSSAAEAVLRFLDSTAVGRRREADGGRAVDEWDMERLDGGDETWEQVAV